MLELENNAHGWSKWNNLKYQVSTHWAALSQTRFALSWDDVNNSSPLTTIFCIKWNKMKTFRDGKGFQVWAECVSEAGERGVGLLAVYDAYGFLKIAGHSQHDVPDNSLSTMFHEDSVDTAMMIWEAILEQKGESIGWTTAFDIHGTAQVRSSCKELVSYAEEIYHIIPEEIRYSVSYDWDFIPSFVHYLEVESSNSTVIQMPLGDARSILEESIRKDMEKISSQSST